MKPDQRRDAYTAWFTALGIDPSTVPLDAEFMIQRPADGPAALRIEVFRTDTEGQRLQHGNFLIYDWKTVPLTVEPPGGQLPNHPQRGDLIDAIVRARALADRIALTSPWGRDVAQQIRAVLDIPGV